ncbi:MAG: hypothetical protein ABI594_03910 [Ginsengibacter sp.]
MKKITVCSMLLIFAASSFCQQIQKSSTLLTREEYLKKSRTQKTVGFVLLGAGAVALLSVSGGNTDFGTLGTVVVAGGVSILASIPFFIASGKNKRKANNASLAFKFEKSQTIQSTEIGFHSFPALSLTLNL